MNLKPHGVLLICFLLTAGIAAKAQLPVHDNFEGKTLSKLWDTSRFEKGAVVMQSEIVKSGHGAAKITLHQGEKYEAGNDSSLESERAELLEARKLVSKEDKSYGYAFSMFIPNDFPIVPTRLVIAQWKQYCGGGICDDDSPVLALRYTRGILQITIQTGPHRTVMYETTGELRGKWIDFKVDADFSRTTNGFVKVWINGAPVLNYNGKSCYSSERGYPASSYFYFKMGLYRDKMAQPMTIYIDDYSKRELTEP
jgi:hypothetical protein